MKRTGGGTQALLAGRDADHRSDDQQQQFQRRDPTPSWRGRGLERDRNGARQSFTFRIRTTIAAGRRDWHGHRDRQAESTAYTDRGGGTFRVTWNCANNTAPVVTLAGVTAGASYEFGSVPSATCTRTDDHEGSGSITPTIGALSGPRAAAGLGSQTVSCSYTDAGGLTGTASATYSVVDTTAPALS